MSNSNDGGPAFPAMKYTKLQTGERHDDYDAAITGQGAKVTHYELTGHGMTLRDYFAAKAMQAIITLPEKPFVSFEEIARKAYEQADAMLSARESKAVTA